MEAASVLREEEMYFTMRTSPGGVMLLVRLHADLALLDHEDLVRPISLEEAQRRGGRLAVTVAWIIKRFGTRNARRAVSEAAAEILETRPRSPQSVRPA